MNTNTDQQGISLEQLDNELRSLGAQHREQLGIVAQQEKILEEARAKQCAINGAIQAVNQLRSAAAAPKPQSPVPAKDSHDQS
ncbi:hypothetical protein [Nibricoccus sp. IMCC34717]|uniref:hypothetical protein n=1 Tax=Nibricoccus sp. IMCC34717 TaxID=3034021 RepID=UPI00384ADFAF